jgi:glyoxylase-like metal-dependent hydrolase (beta-lactamase superfamily II)
MGIMVDKKAFSRLRANVFVVHDQMFPLYVIRGEQNILIDCSILAKAGEIEENLSSLLGNERITLALLTHSHYDHTGTCAYLQARHHFNISASQRTKEIMQNPDAIEFMDKLNQDFKRLLKQDNSLHLTMAENISVVHEGDKIPVVQNQWLQVYETPGHTRCSLSFLLQPENILFPGDAAGIIEKSGKIKPLFLSSYTLYEQSLIKLGAIKANILALPHNTAIKGEKKIREFFQKSLSETQKLKEYILAELRNTIDFALIAEKILNREFTFPTILGPRETILINVTAMVKSIFNEFVKNP